MDKFCALYDPLKDRLFRYAFYRLGNQQDAEDAVSECVLSAYRQFAQLREPGAFAGWIFKILSGVCGRMIEKQIEDRTNRIYPLTSGENSCSQPVSDNPATGQPVSGNDDPADEAALRVDLQRALDQLSTEEREIVLLSVVAGFSSKEIAQMLGSRPGTIRSRQSRSLAKMRAYLGGKHEQ